MTKTIRLKFPDGDYHTALVYRFVSSIDGDKKTLSIWYKDLTVIERTGEEMGSFTLIEKNIDNTYTHLFCKDDYNDIYKELSKSIQKGEYEDISLESLPNSIDQVKEFNYFAKNEEKEPEPEDDISNIIKINKLDEYAIYKYKSSIDLGDYTALSFENVTDKYIEEIDDDKLKEVECIDNYMFFEFKKSDMVFVQKNQDFAPLDCLEYAIIRRFTLITEHNIFEAKVS